MNAQFMRLKRYYVVDGSDDRYKTFNANELDLAYLVNVIKINRFGTLAGPAVGYVSVKYTERGASFYWIETVHQQSMTAGLSLCFQYTDLAGTPFGIRTTLSPHYVYNFNRTDLYQFDSEPQNGVRVNGNVGLIFDLAKANGIE